VLINERWYYSPDLTPPLSRMQACAAGRGIEMAFAKLKAPIRKAAARSYDALWQAVGANFFCELFSDEECYNYFKAAGYEANKMQQALVRAIPIAAGVIVAFSFAAPTSAQSLRESWFMREHKIFGRNRDEPYFYGQLSAGVMNYDDGQSTEVVPFVDNDDSSSRVGFAYEGQWTDELAAFFNVEVEWQPGAVDLLDRDNGPSVDWDGFQLRKLEVRFELSGFGRLWIGQGSMASDGSSEVDHSGSTVIATSDVGDPASQQLFAFSGMPDLSDVRVGKTFRNLDGLGRRARIRYDTPEWHGFRLQGSAGVNALGRDNDIEWDVGARFARNEDEANFKIYTAIAYSRPGGVDDRISASASALHKPSALSLTLAGGYSRNAGNPRDPYFFFGKIGYSPELTAIGQTSFALDVYLGRDFNTIGSESMSVGIAAVQNIRISHNTLDIYGAVRSYAYDDSAASYEDALAVVVGARWRF